MFKCRSSVFFYFEKRIETFIRLFLSMRTWELSFYFEWRSYLNTSDFLPFIWKLLWQDARLTCADADNNCFFEWSHFSSYGYINLLSLEPRAQISDELTWWRQKLLNLLLTILRVINDCHCLTWTIDMLHNKEFEHVLKNELQMLRVRLIILTFLNNAKIQETPTCILYYFIYGGCQKKKGKNTIVILNTRGVKKYTC